MVTRKAGVPSTRNSLTRSRPSSRFRNASSPPQNIITCPVQLLHSAYPCPASGGGGQILHPSRISRWLNNGGRYRRGTFSTFCGINLSSSMRSSSSFQTPCILHHQNRKFAVWSFLAPWYLITLMWHVPTKDLGTCHLLRNVSETMHVDLSVLFRLLCPADPVSTVTPVSTGDVTGYSMPNFLVILLNFRVIAGFWFFYLTQ